VGELAEIAAEGLEGAEIEVVYELRYRGQAFELPIPGSPQPDPDELAEDFAREHESRYGYRDPEGRLELVTIRVAAVVPGPEPRPRAAHGEGLQEETRDARFSAAWLPTRAIRGEPAAGYRAEGPAVFELPEATLVLPPGWSATVDEAGTITAEGKGESR
jgi:N-methylhydantoinase A